MYGVQLQPTCKTWQRVIGSGMRHVPQSGSPSLHPAKIKDADGRRPNDEDYNPRTLYIPPNWFKAAKVSEGQRQWYVPWHAP